MATETKNWVLVSTQISRDFAVLDFRNSERDLHASIISGWKFQAYEVPEWGSFEGVQVTENDRFVAQVVGTSFEDLKDQPLKAGPIGDIRPWGGEYLIVTPNGDYMKMVDNFACYEVFAPQKFGLKPYPTWDPAFELGEDLTDQVFGE